MAGLTIELDAAGSAVGGGNPDGTAYLLDSTNGYSLLGFEAPEPEQDLQWASSADTEGELLANQRYHNRTVTIQLRLAKASDALVQAELNTLGKKIGKLGREGGTLKVTVPSGTVCYFDVANAAHGFPWDQRLVRVKRSEITVTLPCKPFIRVAEVTLSDHVETTLPVLVFTEASVPGDVPALGRLVIDEDQAVSQWWMTWGIQSRYYDSAASAALFYEAEGRTALGGSATAVGPTGASGAGSNVMRNTALPADYIAILSTQATAAGAHLSHVGSLRAYARVQVPITNTGLVTVALEWSEADFLRYTRNAATTIPSEHEGRWRLVDLGLVTTTKVLSGTQRWEGRIVAKSTVIGDDIDIDYLFFVPATEGSGIASGVNRPFTPTAYVGQDDYTSTTAGVALNARVAPTGGTWATSGDATDYAFSDDVLTSSTETIKRSASSGTNGRFAILGATNYAGVIVESRVINWNVVPSGGTNILDQGVIARWVDSANYLRAVLRRNASTGLAKTLEIRQLTTAGGEVLLATTAAADWPGSFGSTSIWWRVVLTVTTGGLATAQLISTGEGTGAPTAGTVTLSVSASSADLATGGTLATGKPGIFDRNGSPITIDRYYDNFLVAATPSDAAAFASQSIEVRSDRVLREDSGGTMWSKPSSYVGDYLDVPPSGAETRTNRVIIKLSRNDPFELDSGIDDLSARLSITSRYLAMPS